MSRPVHEPAGAEEENGWNILRYWPPNVHSDVTAEHGGCGHSQDTILADYVSTNGQLSGLAMRTSPDPGAVRSVAARTSSSRPKNRGSIS